MTIHRPCVNGLVLKRNIPIVVRDGTYEFVPNVLLPIGQSIILFLSFSLVLFLVFGVRSFVPHDLAVKSHQPLAWRHLELDLDAVAESKLCFAAKINTHYRFGGDLHFLVLVGRNMDVEVHASTNQHSISNLSFVEDLVKPVDPQPLFESLYPHFAITDEVGFVILFERYGIDHPLELQSPDLVSLFLQGMKGYERTKQPRLDALLHLGLEDGQLPVFVFVANLDGNYPYRSVRIVDVVFA